MIEVTNFQETDIPSTLNDELPSSSECSCGVCGCSACDAASAGTLSTSGSGTGLS
jgi:hypothetical protein